MNLPQGWLQVKIPDVVEWSSGGTPKSDNPKYYNGTIPWLIIGDLTDSIVYSSATKITELGMKESNAKYVEKDSVLLAMYGSIGKLGIAGVRLTTNQAIAFSKSLNGINNWYLFFYLQLIKSKLFSLSKGGTQKNISLTVVNSLSIPLPPLPEQQRIVTRIESLFSELDNGVTLLKIIKTQLAVYRQGVLKWAFEGKLMKNNNIKFYTKEISKFFNISGGLTKNSKRDRLMKKIPYLRVANVFYNFIDISEIKMIGVLESEIEKTLLLQDDLLFVEGNGSKEQIGRVAFWDGKIDKCLHQNHIIKGRPNGTMLTKYAVYYFMSKQGRDQILRSAASTSGLYTLSVNKIKSFIIPYCSHPEQLAIVSAIESRLSVCDKLEQTIDQTIALSASLRQSILKKAFEGRLVPQDPNDEPAEKLLERIKAEKAAVLAKQKQTQKRGKND
jgi:type I restriction enzyme S subunit